MHIGHILIKIDIFDIKYSNLLHILSLSANFGDVNEFVTFIQNTNLVIGKVLQISFH